MRCKMYSLMSFVSYISVRWYVVLLLTAVSFFFILVFFKRFKGSFFVIVLLHLLLAVNFVSLELWLNPNVLQGVISEVLPTQLCSERRASVLNMLTHNQFQSWKLRSQRKRTDDTRERQQSQLFQHVKHFKT